MFSRICWSHAQVAAEIKVLFDLFHRNEASCDPLLPERNHVAQFGGQAAELIGRQVQVDQVGQLGDVRRDAGQVVVVDVQRRQVSQGP